MTLLWALGFMSGTSLDGVDAAIIRTDGTRVDAVGATGYRPYAPAQRAALRDTLAAAAALTPEAAAEPERWRDIAAIVTDAHLAAAAEIDYSAVELIGFHGQTILHRPEARVTVQVGDAKRLAGALRRPVAHDFRAADVAAGGQGAPLAAFYHFALAQRAGLTESCAFLNMGGVGNVSFVDPTRPSPDAPGALVAFDTGPANAPIDDFVRARSGAPYDPAGALAAAGRIDEERVARWAASAAYLALPAPKSLDREDFSFIGRDLDGHSTEDGAATLTDFAAYCAAAATAFAPQPPKRWFVTGGGRRNTTLMARLAARLEGEVAPVEALGVDGDYVEAQAFAFLAARVARGLPISAPGSTGCPAPVAGGRIMEPSGVERS